MFRLAVCILNTSSLQLVYIIVFCLSRLGKRSWGDLENSSSFSDVIYNTQALLMTEKNPALQCISAWFQAEAGNDSIPLSPFQHTGDIRLHRRWVIVTFLVIYIYIYIHKTPCDRRSVSIPVELCGNLQGFCKLGGRHMFKQFDISDAVGVLIGLALGMNGPKYVCHHYNLRGCMRYSTAHSCHIYHFIKCYPRTIFFFSTLVRQHT